MENQREIVPGEYEHYKGKRYRVIGVAHHSETHEKLVVYRILYESEDFEVDALWVRPLQMFTENVVVDEQEVPRFRLIQADE